jgi:tetratricopeptide (TPR) repeat protein
MMEQELLKQLNRWHEEDEYNRIIARIEEIPVQERDYDAINHLARAFNNAERYMEALQQLQSVAKQGERDHLWQFRAGYAYYYLAQYSLALAAFEKADRLEPGDGITNQFIDWTRPKAERMLRDQQRHLELTHAGLHNNSEDDQIPWTDFDTTSFWEHSDYALKEYVSAPPTDELIASLEQELGYKLPASYIALMQTQNGGIPLHTNYPTEEATSWADDHIAISGIMGIGRDKSYSLGGDLGSSFMIEEWGYPNIGIVICDCPSAGHDVVMLDYRLCGPEGEPSVVHVDQENDYEITYLAPDFETFVRGLVDEEDVAVEQGAQESLAEQLKPFMIVDHSGKSWSVILNAGSYKADVFETRADEGFEGSGYDWASLAAVYLEEKLPELEGIVRFDPEADMFCAYSGNQEALEAFALGFKEACENDVLIRDLFSRAELD